MECLCFVAVVAVVVVVVFSTWDICHHSHFPCADIPFTVVIINVCFTLFSRSETAFWASTVGVERNALY